ncbi:DNA methyltransferase [Planococcus sp. CAU13]|uniref:DNA methyltransferase n=1 Tax=Planococcus sp. CAU13 TaxID=1541197 RepID=UPI0005300542|nr:DNA methyltransferase [Planococcus sp. CAU13]
MTKTLIDNNNETKPKKGGPPNRINDLNYSTWMKFQKSFFRFNTVHALIEEYVYFFTKATWPTGVHSNSLIIGFKDFDAIAIPSPRNINHFSDVESLKDLTAILENENKKEKTYDLILIDLLSLIKDKDGLTDFLNNFSNQIFGNMKNILKEESYCSVFVSTGNSGGAGFPLPWAVAKASRQHLRLRDEKVALKEDDNTVFYCLIMQNKIDEDQGFELDPRLINMANENVDIPAWTLPAAPPRKKNEVLHPAKYPETLVAEFIKIFTNPGDNVLDPMVGTGSTVIAAIETDRNGYGIELNEKYADIASQRVAEKFEPTLFEDFLPQVRGVILNADATQISRIEDLKNVKFQYSITSPPYWSMLSNKGSENQRKRREKKLDIVYSENENDLGNIESYLVFIKKLVEIYNDISVYLSEGSYITIIVKNIKRDHIVYPFAWDLVSELCGPNGKYSYVGNTLWCQDNIGLKPFAVGTHWVSNTLHNYCIHLKKRT